jgi:hypothetical protein
MDHPVLLSSVVNRRPDAGNPIHVHPGAAKVARDGPGAAHVQGPPVPGGAANLAAKTPVRDALATGSAIRLSRSNPAEDIGLTSPETMPEHDTAEWPPEFDASKGSRSCGTERAMRLTAEQAPFTAS